MVGKSEDDELWAGGSDLIRGERCNDTLLDGTRNDSLVGNLGADHIFCGAGTTPPRAGATMSSSSRNSTRRSVSSCRAITRKRCLRLSEPSKKRCVMRVVVAVSDLGVRLMRQAFAKDRGPLTDESADPGEQEAMMHLFGGAIGVFKNPSSHRTVNYDDPTLAAEAVLLADLLLRLVDIAAGQMNLLLEDG